MTDHACACMGQSNGDGRPESGGCPGNKSNFFVKSKGCLIHDTLELSVAWFRFLTPKVFANFSPGLSFGNHGFETVCPLCIGTLKGFAPMLTLSGLVIQYTVRRFPRVAKAQPWAEIRQHLRCSNALIAARRR